MALEYMESRSSDVVFDGGRELSQGVELRAVMLVGGHLCRVGSVSEVQVAFLVLFIYKLVVRRM